MAGKAGEQGRRGPETGRERGKRFLSCVTLLKYATRVVYRPRCREARLAAEELCLYRVVLKRY